MPEFFEYFHNLYLDANGLDFFLVFIGLPLALLGVAHEWYRNRV